MKREMKTPISYYGGKQQMLQHILPKIPQHRIYVEPFFGGGAVFWGKQPSDIEIVNDLNNRLITFYKVLKYDFDELSNKADETFHARAQHRESGEIYKSQAEEITDPLACAWAVWVQTNMSFATRIGGTFGYDRSGSSALKLFNKKRDLTDAYQARMKRVTIESYDAIKVIKTYDGPDTFFYLDPPYVSSNQGHYAGYNEEQFRELLDVCASMKGKFLLSSYPEDILKEYRQKSGWRSEDHEKSLAVDGKRKLARNKTECLSWNY
jgi:DNA adenine methylase